MIDAIQKELVCVSVNLEPEVAAAFGKFLKQMYYPDWREYATSEEEAYQMQYACHCLYGALREQGYAPR